MDTVERKAKLSAAQCPACHTPLSREGSSAGLCPSCLLELALESPTLLAELEELDEEATLVYAREAYSPGQVLGNRYRIRSLLGRGGMGEVWRAYDLKLRVDVALKALRRQLLEDDRALETLRREVRAARAVVSPNVCRVFDLVELDGQELVSMEYIDGITLLDILQMRAPLDLAEARDIAAQFLAGLEAIHDAGLVHRDVKPENLMMTRSGRVVLMDFGIAKGLTEGRTGTVAGTLAYMAPEQARGEALDARADVFSAGVVLAEMIAPGGLRSFEARQQIWQGIQNEPPQIAESPWAFVLSRAVSRQKEQRFGSAAALARALEEVTLRVAGAEDLEPYPGLAAFTEADAEYFFGRELEVEEMWKKLHRPHLLGLIGPSGAGKSSFLRAGLLPTMPTGWRAVVSTPGARPFMGLARTLAKELAGDEAAVQDLLQFDDLDVAVSVVSGWRKSNDEVLIVVDQFEELFTLNPLETQERFAELLGRLALEADAHILVSMRDDFLFHCHAFQPLHPMLSELTLLGPPTGATLRRAVVQPALKCGYRFEDESVVEEMVAEVGSERGALPMLAFAAARLWDHRDREQGLLTREAYEHIGGIGGALAQHAEATLERIGQDRIPIVRELFRNLVTAQGTRAARDREELLSVFEATGARYPATARFPTGSRKIAGGRPSVPADHAPAEGGEPESQASRRRSFGARAAGSGEATEPKGPTPTSQEDEAAEEVLDALIDARLLTSYEVPASDEGAEPHHRVEIVHESLLKAWPRLVRWQTQDADSAQLRDQIRQAAQMWEERGRPDDLLWTGTSFGEYRLWRERYEGGLTTAEEEFGAAMTHRAERKRRRRRIAVTAAFGVLLAILGVIAWFGWQAELERRRAEAEARRAEAAKLLAIAQLQLEADPTEALAYATASLELADSEEARVFVMKALAEAPPALVLDGLGMSGRAPHFSPDGRWLALAGHAEEVLVFHQDGTGPIRLAGHAVNPQGAVDAAWFGNRILVTGHWTSGRVRLWSIPEGEVIREIDFGSRAFWRVGGDSLLAEVIEAEASTGKEMYHLRSWRLPDGDARELGTVAWTALGANFEESVFEPGGRGWVYTRGNGVYHRRLPARDGEPDRLVGTHANEARVTLIASEPNQVWTRDTETAELKLWDLSNPDRNPLRVVSWPEEPSESERMALDASGRWLVEAGFRRDGRKLWALDSWPESSSLRLRRRADWYGSLTSFDPGSRWIVSSTGNWDQLVFWPLPQRSPVVVEGYVMYLFRPLEFSPDSRSLATVWPERSLRLWPVPPGDEQVRVLFDGDIPEDVLALSFDPTGERIAGTGFGPDLFVASLDGGLLRKLEGFSRDHMVYSEGFSPSGTIVAAGTGYGTGIEKTLRVWNLETGEVRQFDLEQTKVQKPPGPEGPPPDSGSEGGIFNLAFTDDSTLYTAGGGGTGVLRWDLETGTFERIRRAGHSARLWMSGDRRRMITLARGPDSCEGLMLHDLQTGDMRELETFWNCNRTAWEPIAFDETLSVMAIAHEDGTLGVGRLHDPEPHLLVGHEGFLNRAAISADLQWVASSSTDNTLRLWPMPDFDEPPLQTLPREELIAKLKSLTNLRAVRDPESSTGWSIEIGPFPGWKEVPTW